MLLPEFETSNTRRLADSPVRSASRQRSRLAASPQQNFDKNWLPTLIISGFPPIFPSPHGYFEKPIESRGQRNSSGASRLQYLSTARGKPPHRERPNADYSLYQIPALNARARYRFCSSTDDLRSHLPCCASPAAVRSYLLDATLLAPTSFLPSPAHSAHTVGFCISARGFNPVPLRSNDEQSPPPLLPTVARPFRPQRGLLHISAGF